MSERSYIEPIKSWKPLHDQVLLLHMSGKKNTEIAKSCKISVVRVSQILTDPMAQTLIEQYRQQVRDNVLNSIEDRLLGLAQKSVENIAETVETQFAPGTKQKQHQDFVGFKLLETVGFGKKDRPDQNQGGINLSEELGGRLVTAIEKANRIREDNEIIIDAEVE